VFGLFGDLVVAVGGDGDDAAGAGGEILNGNLNGSMGRCALRASLRPFDSAQGRAEACFARGFLLASFGFAQDRLSKRVPFRAVGWERSLTPSGNPRWGPRSRVRAMPTSQNRDMGHPICGRVSDVGATRRSFLQVSGKSFDCSSVLESATHEGCGSGEASRD
jgi:hypothetical protein